MPSSHPYDMTTPCAQCPFRNDRPGYLSAARVEEIRAGLVRGEFPCHKTTESVESADGECTRRETRLSKHCAGALILMEKEEAPSQMIRIAERLGMYDCRGLDMGAPVYENWDEMIEAQPR